MNELTECKNKWQHEKELLLDVLSDVINQACFTKDKKIDSMATTAYAEGIRMLAEHGKVRILKEHGRRIIAEWKG